MKIFKEASTYSGRSWDVIQYDVDSFSDLRSVDDELIEKVHAVCMFQDKVVVVNHPEWDIWGLPGGTREKGESLEETLRREIQEETNCEILTLVPTSYQKFVERDGTCSYRAQFFCKVRPLGEFESDTAGNITKIAWINPGQLEDYIENKSYRKAIVQRITDNLEYYKNL